MNFGELDAAEKPRGCLISLKQLCAEEENCSIRQIKSTCERASESIWLNRNFCVNPTNISFSNSDPLSELYFSQETNLSGLNLSGRACVFAWSL